MQLVERPRGVETWWSGNLWKDNYRRTETWEALTVAMADIDFRVDDVHVEVPEEIRARVVLEELPGSFLYHTPRGLRAARVLDVPVTDADAAGRLNMGLARAVVSALEARGIFGYEPDRASKVRAQLFYMHNATVAGKDGALVERNSPCVVGVDISMDEMIALGADAGESPDVNVSAILAKMPANGQNDGSMELIFAAKKAIGLGVYDAMEFVSVASMWNAKRQVAWTDEQLIQRFSDVYRRWEAAGMAVVGAGSYRIQDLHKILKEDRLYAGRFAWDVREAKARLNGALLEDSDVTGLRVDICRRYAYPTIPKNDVFDVVQNVAKGKLFDRVSEYLAELPTWDGQSRDVELVDALSILPEQREIAAVYLRKMRIAAVARVVEPGCKQDNVFVLVGKEGMGKSKFFAALAGRENFCDTQIDLTNKDAYLQILGTWIYEFAELEAVTRKADVARVKSFLSSAVDKYRAPYDRVTGAHPRRGIVVGTSNSHDLVIDADSNRRLWISEINGEIDVAWVEQMRDQLWAEAVEAYAQGEPWWLTTEWEEIRRGVNADYEPDRPLAEKLPAALEEVLQAENRGNWFKPEELYRVLGVDTGTANNAIFTFINSHLKRAGFRRSRLRLGQFRMTAYLRAGAIVSDEARNREFEMLRSKAKNRLTIVQGPAEK